MNHPRLGEIVCVRSARARRVSISVRASGVVRLSYPLGVSERRALEFVEQKVEWIEKARIRMAARISAAPLLPAVEAKVHVEELRRQAHADLPGRVEQLSQQTGLHCRKLSIRASRSKWGSCSGANHISLSLFLMTLPDHLRDYVIVHELCHTVHHDHSPYFHALVDRHLGGQERSLRRELRGYVTAR